MGSEKSDLMLNIIFEENIPNHLIIDLSLFTKMIDTIIPQYIKKIFNLNNNYYEIIKKGSKHTFQVEIKYSTTIMGQPKCTKNA